MTCLSTSRCGCSGDAVFEPGEPAGDKHSPKNSSHIWEPAANVATVNLAADVGGEDESSCTFDIGGDGTEYAIGVMEAAGMGTIDGSRTKETGEAKLPTEDLFASNSLPTTPPESEGNYVSTVNSGDWTGQQPILNRRR